MSYTAVVEVHVDGIAINYSDTTVAEEVFFADDGTLLLCVAGEIVEEYGPGDWVRLTLTPGGTG